MPEIHPTAIVDPDVRLGDDVYIGPGCTLRGKVTIGPGGQLHGFSYLHGPLTIGRNVRIYPYACIGFAPQHRGYNPAVDGAGIIIGDDNFFREGVTVNRAFADDPTRIGDRVYCMANSHVGHDAVLGNDITLVQGAVVGGHAQIGDAVMLGGNSGIHQFARVGRLGLIAGGVGAPRDVPPFCVYHHTNRISGLNVVGLRRAGYRAHIKALQRAFELLFRSGLSNATAASRIERELGEDPLCLEFARFIPGTKRGICRTTAATDDERGDASE